MRIRKHAKISPLLYATSSLKAGALIQTHVCQLNQSPWDVMTFSPLSSPPPPFQANGSGVRGGNESSGHCVSVPKRELASRRQSEYSAAATPKVEAAAPPENQASIMCCKTDGKSWQCRREAANGNSICEHHISLVRSYSNVSHNASEKSVKPAAEGPRRARPKKAPAASSSNPYEFYYYSGFGPRWGQRRGENRKNDGSSMPKNVEEEAAAGIEEFDFEELEDEDDEEEEMNGKKRVRKPIKARSLKSLL